MEYDYDTEEEFQAGWDELCEHLKEDEEWAREAFEAFFNRQEV